MTQSRLSMLAGFSKKRSFVPEETTSEVVDQIEEVSNETLENNVIDVTITNQEVTEDIVWTEDNTQSITDDVREEVETETKTEETEEDNDSEEGEDEDIDVENLSEDEKKIYDKYAEILKKSWEKTIDKLSEIKWFDKLMLAVEDELYKSHNEKKELETKTQELEDKIQELRKEQVEKAKEWELNKIEIQRYSLDDNDEYILDLKKRLSKDSSNETLKNKLRDEYLRGISEVDPEFDMFEYRNKALNKRAAWIENLSGSNRSTAAVIEQDKPKPMWFSRRG